MSTYISLLGIDNFEEFFILRGDVSLDTKGKIGRLDNISPEASNQATVPCVFLF